MEVPQGACLLALCIVITVAVAIQCCGLLANYSRQLTTKTPRVALQRSKAVPLSLHPVPPDLALAYQAYALSKVQGCSFIPPGIPRQSVRLCMQQQLGTN